MQLHLDTDKLTTILAALRRERSAAKLPSDARYRRYLDGIIAEIEVYVETVDGVSL